MTALPLLPAVAVEFFGSGLAIVFSFTAFWYSWALVRLRPDNFIWGFLFYFCIAMAAFSLSRGVGHMVRICLVYSGHVAIWKKALAVFRWVQYHVDDFRCSCHHLLP